MNLFAQYYDYNYEATSTASDLDPATAAVLISGFIMFGLAIVLVSYAVTAFLLGRIFKKAGVEQWKAWVPIYNGWVMLELGGQQGFWAVLALIPFVNIVSAVFTFIAMYHIGLKLGKEGAFVLLGIFLPIVWLVWLAFDDSKWHGKKVAATHAAATAEK